jgi:hypothetical protein
MGSCRGPRNQWSPQSDWKLGFIAFLLPKGGDFGGMHVKEGSPWCKQMFLGKEKGFTSTLSEVFICV